MATPAANIPKKKPKKNNYFLKVHEEAIIQYASTEDNKIRTELYILYIEPAFSEMVDKIVYTYKFNNLPNIDSLKEECKVWLMTILDKYDPAKKSKAFSYFSVITKNWFIHKVKKNTKNLKREVQFEEISGAAHEKHFSIDHPYETDREQYEFWQHLWGEINSWDNLKLKDNEKKVLEAVKILFETVDQIEIFNKKAIYLYIREITGLNTKQVVNNLNKIRTKYRVFKTKWDEGKT
jgi:hypothetical protein|tara:strand:- start:1638 stop:2345 length:708 start_codon:yes stop_codon:yes gene_type:complete